MTTDEGTVAADGGHTALTAEGNEVKGGALGVDARLVRGCPTNPAVRVRRESLQLCAWTERLREWTRRRMPFTSSNKAPTTMSLSSVRAPPRKATTRRTAAAKPLTKAFAQRMHFTLPSYQAKIQSCFEDAAPSLEVPQWFTVPATTGTRCYRASGFLCCPGDRLRRGR